MDCPIMARAIKPCRPLLFLAGLALCCLGLVLATSASAAVRTWTGGGDGVSWNQAANWDTGVPAAGDDVVFNPAPAAQINVPAGSSSGTLTVSGANPLRITTGGGALTLSGLITLTNASNGLVLSNSTLTAQGAITGAGYVSLDNSTVNLQSPCAYTGPTTASNGSVINLAAGAGLPDSGALTLNGSTFNLNGINDTIGSLADSVGTPGSVALGGATLTLGGNNASTTFYGNITGNGRLVKTGSGTLTLMGNNTFTGTVTVSGGTLLDRAGLPNVDPATVQSGTTLGGSGPVGGSVVVQNGGTLSPGASTDVFYVNTDLTMNAGSRLYLELNGMPAGPGHDQVDVLGAVNLNSPNLAVNLGYTPALGDRYIIINNNGGAAVNGTFNGLPEGATLTANGYTLQITYLGPNGVGNDVELAVTGLPSSPTPSPPTPTPPTPDPLAPPHIVQGSSPDPTGSVGGVGFTWPRVPGSNFYRVYRAACPTCPREEVGRVPGNDFYDPTAIPGRAYYYWVRTENGGGLSTYSNWLAGWSYEQNPGRAGDFNGDGVTDILWWEPGSNQLRIWFMASGQVQLVSPPGQGLDISQWLLISTGNYNGDGVWDLLWWNPTSGEVAVWYLEGTSSAAMSTAADSWLVKSKASLANMTGNATLSYPGDLNGDNRDDLLWRDYASGQVTVWLLDADGNPTLNGPPSFQDGYPATKRGSADLGGDEVTQENQPASSDLPGVTGSLSWQVRGLADMNGDGKADVVWQNSADNRLVMWLMDGSVITAVNEYSARNAGGWHLSGLGDLDGDGRADVVWQNQASGAVKAWLMGPAGEIKEQRGIGLGTDDPSWQIKAAGDFGGDKCDDLLCKQQGTGQSRVVTLSGQVHELAAP